MPARKACKSLISRVPPADCLNAFSLNSLLALTVEGEAESAGEEVGVTVAMDSEVQVEAEDEADV